MKSVIYFGKRNYVKINKKYYYGYLIFILIYIFILMFAQNLINDYRVYFFGCPFFIFIISIFIYIVLYNKRFIAINPEGIVAIPGLFNKIPIDTYEFLPSVSPTNGIYYRFHIENIQRIHIVNSDLPLKKYSQKIYNEKKTPMNLVEDTSKIICIELKESLKRNIKEAIFYNKKIEKYHYVDKNINSKEIYITIDQSDDFINIINQKINNSGNF